MLPWALPLSKPLVTFTWFNWMSHHNPCWPFCHWITLTAWQASPSSKHNFTNSWKQSKRKFKKGEKSLAGKATKDPVTLSPKRCKLNHPMIWEELIRKPKTSATNHGKHLWVTSAKIRDWRMFCVPDISEFNFHQKQGPPPLLQWLEASGVHSSSCTECHCQHM